MNQPVMRLFGSAQAICTGTGAAPFLKRFLPQTPMDYQCFATIQKNLKSRLERRGRKRIWQRSKFQWAKHFWPTPPTCKPACWFQKRSVRTFNAKFPIATIFLTWRILQKATLPPFSRRCPHSIPNMPVCWGRNWDLKELLHAPVGAQRLTWPNSGQATPESKW